jgi:lipid A ethanolaminephosphotransferase
MPSALRRLALVAPLPWQWVLAAVPSRERHPFWLVGWVSLWMATAGNVALWRELAQLQLLDGVRGSLFALSVTALLVALLSGLIGTLAWRATLKPVLTLLLLVSAFSAHFMMTYHVVLDTTMMTNVLQTQPREARELLGWRLFATVLVIGVIPSMLVWRTPLRRIPWSRRLIQNAALTVGSLAAAVAVLLAAFQPMSSAMRNHRHVRHLANPLNVVQAIGQIAAQPLRRNDAVVLPIGEDAHLGSTYATQARPPLLVLVVGETGRSGNFALNGYARPTTPELARAGVTSLRNAWSCGTSTAVSVPCMFSHLGRAGFDSRDSNFEGLLDVLQRAGLAVLWLDNQTGCKGACARVATVATTAERDADLCDSGECFDEIMLRGLDERIAALPAERRARGLVVVMHPLGSHGPAYYKRTPAAFKRFMPECASNILQDCSQEQLVNAYDNTIAYTDHFLAATIDWLKQRETVSEPALVYVADHGESLGENNLYLHGLPYAVAPDVQKHVAWISWMSPSFERRRGLSTGCLNRRADAPVSHDNYFHSVLGLLDIQTGVYRRELDVYAPCDD